jgi:hypothetical protein
MYIDSNHYEFMEVSIDEIFDLNRNEKKYDIRFRMIQNQKIYTKEEAIIFFNDFKIFAKECITRIETNNFENDIGPQNNLFLQ